MKGCLGGVVARPDHRAFTAQLGRKRLDPHHSRDRGRDDRGCRGTAASAAGQLMTSGRAIWYAIATGLSRSCAIARIGYGFNVLKLPVSNVAPLTDGNALVVVA